MTTRHAIVETSLGALTVVASDGAIAGLYFPQHWYLPPSSQLGELVDSTADGLLASAETQLRDYLAGDRHAFDLPLSLSGTPLQQQVWTILQRIPFGETTTYGAIAEQLGDRRLAQAVGQAVGHNPVSIVIPCHRVVGSTGKLTGFAGGLERKRVLLQLEEPEAVDRLF